MAKGSYAVGENKTPSARKDTSYRSFICALLIFLIICLIILLVSLNWGGKHEPSRGEPSRHHSGKLSKDKDETEVLQGRKPNKTSEKIVAESTTLLNRLKTTAFEESERESTTVTPSIGKEDKQQEIIEFELTPGRDTAQFTTTERQLESTTNEYHHDVIVTKISKEKDSLLSTTTTSIASTNYEHILTETSTSIYDNNVQSKISKTISEKPTAKAEYAKFEYLHPSTSTDSGDSSTETTVVTTVESTTDAEDKRIKFFVLTPDSSDDDNSTEITTTSMIKPTSKKPEENEPLQSTFTASSSFTNNDDNSTETTVVTTVRTDAEDKNIKSSVSTTPDSPGDDNSTEITTTTMVKNTSKKPEAIDPLEPIFTTFSSFTSNFDNSTETTVMTTVESATHTQDKGIESLVSTTPDSHKEYFEEFIYAAPFSTNQTEASNPTTVASSTISDNDSTKTTRIQKTTPSSTQNEERQTKNKEKTTSTTETTIMESDGLSDPPENPVCDNAVCKTAASRILSMMDHEANPCEDFYEFSCGRVYEEEEPAKVLVKLLEVANASSSPKYLKDFKEFYYSCLEHENSFNYRERMSGVETLLTQVGQFQLDSQSEVPNLTNLVSQLLLRQSMPLFDIGIDVDKQSSNFILQLTLPQQSFLRTGVENWSGLSLLKNECLQKQKSSLHNLYLNLSTIYESYQRCQHDYATYLKSIQNVIQELGAFSNLSSETLRKEIQDIRFVIEFDVLNNLDSLPTSAEILGDFINKDYEVRKISDLQVHHPILEWKNLFQTITGHQVYDNSTVQVYFSKYFKHIFASLAEVEKRKLNNAFMAIYAYDLFINTVIPKEKSNRDRFCTDLTKKLMPDVWSNFVQSTYSTKELQNQNTQATNLFELLKRNFYNSLFEVNWMDDDTKISVLKKCNELSVTFCAPPEETILNTKYETLNVTTNYQTNLINLLVNFKQTIYSTESSPMSAQTIFSYFLDPLSRKPLTFYANPTIVVPLGLMRKVPNGLPNYLMLTRAGLALARQMARHFDPTGMKYGIKLKSKSKSQASYSNFVANMVSMMDHSSPRIFQQKNISFYLNGSLSTNERMVDNAAFKLIFDSFSLSSDRDILPWISSQFSREKVFFIAAAQELCRKTSVLDFMLQVFEQRHLPAMLRVENIMGNSEGFLKEFTCPVGSGMDVFDEKLQFPNLIELDDYDHYEEYSQKT